MKCKTFECPYLTEEDKKFLEYEQKIYEEALKRLQHYIRSVKIGASRIITVQRII